MGNTRAADVLAVFGLRDAIESNVTNSLSTYFSIFPVANPTSTCVKWVNPNIVELFVTRKGQKPRLGNIKFMMEINLLGFN